MNNTTYQAILDLLIAYHNEWTLSRDEFDAVEHYQQVGYKLVMSEIFYGEYPGPDYPIQIDHECLAYRMIEQSTGLKVICYLFKEGEQ